MSDDQVALASAAEPPQRGGVRGLGQRIAPGMAVAAGAQGLSAVQLLLLLHRAGASVPVDGFLVGLVFAQAPTSAWAVGILYPIRLARPQGGTWPKEHAWGAAAGLAAALAGIAVIAAEQGAATAAWVGGPLAVFSTFSSATAVSAIGLACRGRTQAIVGLSAIPTLCATVALASGLGGSDMQVVAWMCAALGVGSIGTFFLYRRTFAAAAAVDVLPPRARQPYGAIRWLSLGAAIGYGGQLLLQAASGAMREGDATAWGLIQRFCAFTTFVGVTAVLPHFINWHRTPTARVAVPVRVVLLAATVTAVAVAISVAAMSPSGDVRRIAIVAPLASCWIAAAAANAVLTTSVQRLGLFHAYKVSSAITLPIYCAGAAALVVSGSLALGALTLILASIASALSMLRALRWPGLVTPLTGVALVATLISLVLR